MRFRIHRNKPTMSEWQFIANPSAEESLAISLAVQRCLAVGTVYLNSDQAYLALNIESEIRHNNRVPAIWHEHSGILPFLGRWNTVIAIPRFLQACHAR